MVGLSNIASFAARARENVLDGAIEEVGVKIAEKTGFADVASNIISKPINALTGLLSKKSAPEPASRMEKAVDFIQKPSVTGAAVLGLATLYLIGRMTETPTASNLDTDTKRDNDDLNTMKQNKTSEQAVLTESKKV